MKFNKKLNKVSFVACFFIANLKLSAIENKINSINKINEKCCFDDEKNDLKIKNDVFLKNEKDDENEAKKKFSKYDDISKVAYNAFNKRLKEKRNAGGEFVKISEAENKDDLVGKIKNYVEEYYEFKGMQANLALRKVRDWCSSYHKNSVYQSTNKNKYVYGVPVIKNNTDDLAKSIIGELIAYCEKTFKSSGIDNFKKRYVDKDLAFFNTEEKIKEELAEFIKIRINSMHTTSAFKSCLSGNKDLKFRKSGLYSSLKTTFVGTNFFDSGKIVYNDYGASSYAKNLLKASRAYFEKFKNHDEAVRNFEKIFNDVCGKYACECISTEILICCKILKKFENKTLNKYLTDDVLEGLDNVDNLEDLNS